MGLQEQERLQFANNQEEYILRMNTVDDTIDEFDGSVTITLLPPEGQAGVARPYFLVNPSEC